MNRRNFLRQIGYGVAASSLGLPARASKAKPKSGRPNILLIVADDLGFSDLGCYGGEIHTPNLDHLAASGRRFRHAYNCAVCVPTRASLMTGLHPHQAGVGHEFERFGSPRNDVPMVGERLQQTGYQTFLSGKWHLGGGDKRPTARGFDRFFGIEGGASNYFNHDIIRPTPVYLDDRRVELDDDFYMTDAISDHAVRFLADAASTDRPFFLEVAYTAPHFPLHARPEDIAKYRGRYMEGWDRVRKERYARQIEMGLFDGGWELPPRNELETDLSWGTLSSDQRSEWDLHMAVYAAQVDVMDRGIGRVLRKLENLGMEENTLVIFISDNGACASRLYETEPGKLAQGVAPGPADSYKAYGLWWANASNTPFRLYKTLLHEGGIATPFIASWPGVIDPGRPFCDEPIHVMDFTATCLDLAKAGSPPSARGKGAVPSEGRSWVPLLKGGAEQDERDLCWNLWGNRAIRRGKWKLVSRSNRLINSSFGRWRYDPAPHREGWELYDLVADRTEMFDLAEKRPDIVEALSDAYESWSLRTGAPDWKALGDA